MDATTISALLAKGIVPDEWSTVAARQNGELAPEDSAKLTEGLDAFVDLLLCRLQSLRCRLEHAEFKFALPEFALRTATDDDLSALDAFAEKYGDLPLSVQAWYRRIASFNFGQAGSQMFDRSHGFYFMHRFYQFTMPPIATACSGRWDEITGWEGDDDEHLTEDGRVFFPMEESGMDEDWKGFAIPDKSVDPVIDPEAGTTFLQWADYQATWGGFGLLPRAIEGGGFGELDTETIMAVFRA